MKRLDWGHLGHPGSDKHLLVGPEWDRHEGYLKYDQRINPREDDGGRGHLGFDACPEELVGHEQGNHRGLLGRSPDADGNSLPAGGSRVSPLGEGGGKVLNREKGPLVLWGPGPCAVAQQATCLPRPGALQAHLSGPVLWKLITEPGVNTDD